MAGVCFRILSVSLIELGGDWNAFRKNSGAAYNVKYTKMLKEIPTNAFINYILLY
jgi:hypothetical protein